MDASDVITGYITMPVDPEYRPMRMGTVLLDDGGLALTGIAHEHDIEATVDQRQDIIAAHHFRIEGFILLDREDLEVELSVNFRHTLMLLAVTPDRELPASQPHALPLVLDFLNYRHGR